jgi:hypothetical protein
VEKLGRSEAQEFWQDVSANLEAGKIRMLFVADHIPAELQREALNSHAAKRAATIKTRE